MRLRELQRWFQDEVVRPESRVSPALPACAVVRPSATLAPAERVAIYSRMYISRLLGCLESDFPAVRAVAGERAFARLARAYLAAFPSRHYSLNGLGRALPRFLEDAKSVRRRALLVDVARVEVAMSEVFDEEEAAPLVARDLAGIAPATLASARLRLVPALRLLALDHPVSALVTAALRGRALPRVRRKRSFVLVSRRDYQVQRADITEAQHEILRAFAGGATIGRALAKATRAMRGDQAAREASVMSWFRAWIADGIFAKSLS